MMSDQLLEKEYWNTFYKNKNLRPGKLTIFKKTMINIINSPPLSMFSNIYEHILWEKIFEKFLPKKNGLKILEVGSAPGDRLIKFHKKFDYLPYGIEFTAAGAEVNRRLFKQYNIPPENVCEDDIFSDKVQGKFKNFYDIVISLGFIEHFTNPEVVVEKHLNLLKKGGLLVITIPNLRGKANHALCNFFNKDILTKHNLDIMELQRFQSLFAKKELRSIYCNYYGVFSFSFFNAKNLFRQLLLDICLIIQLFLNFLFRLLIKNFDLESKNTSPFLIFIGEKI